MSPSDSSDSLSKSFVPKVTDTSGMDVLLTVDEVAKYIRVKPQTVRAMARTGKLRGTKVGRDWRFKLADIQELFVMKK